MSDAKSYTVISILLPHMTLILFQSLTLLDTNSFIGRIGVLALGDTTNTASCDSSPCCLDCKQDLPAHVVFSAHNSWTLPD